MTTAAPAPTSAAGRALATADRMFAAEGIAAVPLERVAARAGVSERTLRATYPDQHRLVIAALEFRLRTWVDRLRSATARPKDPRDAILTVFSFQEASVDADNCASCWTRSGYGELGRDVDAARVTDEHLAQVHAHIAHLCHAAGLPTHISDGITLLVQGAQVEAHTRHSSAPVRAARLSAATLMAVYESRNSWF